MPENQADKFYRLAQEQGAAQTPCAASSAPAGRGRYKRAALCILGAYILLCAGVFIFQNRVIFRPQQETALPPRDFGFAAPQAQALELAAADGVALRGWSIVGRSKGNSPAPRLADAQLVTIYFCDRSGNRGMRTEHLRRLAAQGPHVVCFDYRGFGDSTGTPSPPVIKTDARAIWDFVRGQGIPANLIVLQGHGLGAAVAAQLAAALCGEKTPPGGLILEAPFARVTAALAPQWPLVPVGLLLGDQFNTAAALQGVNCSTLVFRGGQDSVLSASAAQQLLAPIPAGLATLVELPRCDRDDIGMQDVNLLLDAARLFYARVCPALAGTPKSTDTTPQPREPHARERKKRIKPDDSAKKP